AKKLQGLVDRILQKFKFKRFKLERKGKHIRLYGEVNPWVLLIDGELRDIKEQNLEKELKKLELDGKKPIKLSDAEYSKLSKLEDTELENISKNADGDKSKIDFKSVKGTGETAPAKKTIPDWIKERWEAGNNFNKENRPHYPYNEVELEAKEAGGKKYVVDSYVPNKQIVSRKFTQLSEVKESTAIGYLKELTQKYSSGSKISKGVFNPNALKGGQLKGQLILEVPIQNKPIPQTILDEATKNRILIKDINGKVYN
ncbi:hypothetical protein, partial [Paenibacillus sp. 22594]|uniref:hypothetical protein n=1 Tax=Paenibacillus sp. 22594 TaxID=3453947 RepID=UPI003F840B3B